MSSLTILILVAIVVSIALAFGTKINTGIFAIVFAFVIGIFVMGLVPKDIIAMFPTTLFFQVFCITFFYSFARQNGTLDLLARKIVYSARKVPYLIPFVLMLTCALIAGLGPGTLVSLLILPPIIMNICKVAKIHPILAVVIFTSGIDVGAWSTITVNATLIQNLAEGYGYAPELAHSLITPIWFDVAIAKILVGVVAYFVFKGFKASADGIEKPEAFNRSQKINLVLIGVFVGCMVIPALISNLTHAAFFTMLKNSIDITYLAILLSIFCILLKLGDEKKAFAMVPWSMTMMICGVGMLIAVATKAGAVQELTDIITNNVSTGIIPYFVLLISGFMSFFSSTTGVVLPTMIPICLGMADATGLSASLLLSGIVMGSTMAGLSPFSTGGAMALVSMEDEDENEKNKVFYGLFGVIAVGILLMFALIAIGVVR